MTMHQPGHQTKFVTRSIDFCQLLKDLRKQNKIYETPFFSIAILCNLIA